MTAAAIDQQVDTSDLGMLDGLRHSACAVCYSEDLSFGTRFIASCGREALASGRTDWATPPNACTDCERRRYDPCPRCDS